MNKLAQFELLSPIIDGLRAGRLIPYLAPAALRFDPANEDIPAYPEELISALGKRVPIPGRLRKNLTAAAQYIETFRHRKLLRTLMCEAFAQSAVPSSLHRWIASLRPPLIVDLGYDAASASALSEIGELKWGQIQGVSRAETRAGQGEDWYRSYASAGHPCCDDDAADWQTLLYKPLGSITPAGNFLVSDADFVEVLTEIDIQTPIPPAVQSRRAHCGFVFIACRFNSQLYRTWARQLLKRSPGPHYALIDAEAPVLTKNELRFLGEEKITLIPLCASLLPTFS